MDRNVRTKLDNVNELSNAWEVDWTSLPDDTMIRLFSCLSYRDRASLSSTCKPWWILSKSPFLWQSLDLRLYNCNAQAARSLASRCNNLHKLRIRGHETAGSVINLKANNLREISIDHCWEITDLTLTILVARHEALECLQIGPEPCENISSSSIKAIALCCPNLKKLWLYGVKDVSGEAINALAENCQRLTDIGFLDCEKVDEAALGNVKTLSFLSVAGTTDINWNSALLHWSNLLDLVCLDVSRTDIDSSSVSELFMSWSSLKVLCALECPSLEHNSASIRRRDKRLVTFFTDILEELCPLFIDMPKGKGNVFLDWRKSNNIKDRKLMGVLDWLELSVCNSLLRVYTSGHDQFLLHQGMILLISFLQSPYEEIQEIAVTTLATFDAEKTKAAIQEGGIRSVVNLARSSQEVLQLESVKAIVNLSKNNKFVKVVFGEGGVDVLIDIARSACKIVAGEALGGLWDISIGYEHKSAIAKVGGIRALVDVIVKCSKSVGGEVLMERAAGALANLAIDEKCSIEAASKGAAPALVNLLRDGMAQDVQAQAARCLANMAMYDDSNGNRASIGQERGAIEALVRLVRSHHDSVKKEAAYALWNLSFDEGNIEAIAAIGGVQALVALANSCSNASFGLQESVAGALWGLSASEEMSIAIGQEGGITALIMLAKSDAEGVHRNAAAALWNLTYNSGNAMRFIQEDGIPTLVHLCSSSFSNMARFMSALVLAFMFDTRLDELATVGTSIESTSKITRLKRGRRVASKAIKAFLKSYSDLQAFSAAASSSSVTATLTHVAESLRIEEMDDLQCSGSEIGRLVNMLGHRSPTLKSCGAFALLQFTLPGTHYSSHKTNVLQNTDALRKLRKVAAVSASASQEAKVFAQIVLRNLEYNEDNSN